jgi:hypothetical protein
MGTEVLHFFSLFAVFDFRLGRADGAEAELNNRRRLAARFARRLDNSEVLMMYMNSNGVFERSAEVSVVVVVLSDRDRLIDTAPSHCVLFLQTVVA